MQVASIDAIPCPEQNTRFPTREITSPPLPHLVFPPRLILLIVIVLVILVRGILRHHPLVGGSVWSRHFPKLVIVQVNKLGTYVIPLVLNKLLRDVLLVGGPVESDVGGRFGCITETLELTGGGGEIIDEGLLEVLQQALAQIFRRGGEGRGAGDLRAVVRGAAVRPRRGRRRRCWVGVLGREELILVEFAALVGSWEGIGQ